MNNILPQISQPELFFPLVAPIGTPLEEATALLEARLRMYGYHPINIRVTELFPLFEQLIAPDKPLIRDDKYARYTSYIEYGNQLRKEFNDDSILALGAISEIIKKRKEHLGDSGLPEKTAFIIRQFKRREEIELLRSVYGEQLFQISIYSRQTARTENLSEVFAKDAKQGIIDPFRPRAEEIINIDRDDVDKEHGQQIGKIFHDADYIVDVDQESEKIGTQINRFCDLLFGANNISPNHDEYGLRLATNAALRSIDLSRQVGAAIFDENQQIASLGSNEVPKGLGGTYWCDDDFDAREYKKGRDSNEDRKTELILEVLETLNIKHKEEALKNLQDSQIMDALEYGRVVHAEMSAISDAARTGRVLKNGTLYCTTFPCHMCAKHIVASGIKRVVFLEPYPKSLVSRLHQDSIEVEQKERGKYKNYPKVNFEHFSGVTPRRFDILFKRSSRKDKESGTFLDFQTDPPTPIIIVRSLEYLTIETAAVKRIRSLTSKLGEK